MRRDREFVVIGRQVKQFSIKRICLWLDVSRAGCYAWVRTGDQGCVRSDDELTVEVKAIRNSRWDRYGSPRIRLALATNGVLSIKDVLG